MYFFTLQNTIKRLRNKIGYKWTRCTYSYPEHQVSEIDSGNTSVEEGLITGVWAQQNASVST